MARTASFIPRFHPNRKTSPWSIVIPPKLSETGRRQERFFATKAEAEGEVQRLKVRKENHGIAAKLLDPAQEQQAVAAFKLLHDAGLEGVQLVEAVSHFVEYQRQRTASRPLVEVWEAYLGLKKRSAVHQSNLRRTLRRFAPLHGVKVSDIRPQDLEKILASASSTYRNAMLRESRAVLTFAVKKGWAQENPARKVDTAEHTVGEREVYSPAEVAAVLKEAATSEPKLLPYLSIGLFAGVRPDVYHGELVKLEWEHVDLVENMIDLPAAITKRRRRRSIPIEPVLAAWLSYFIECNGIQTGKVTPIMGTPLRDRLRAVFARAGVSRKQDATRHSYASYWLAKNRDESELALRLGHIGGTEILHRHYHRAVTARAAEKYWQPTPEAVLGKSKIVSIKEGAA
jgi:integrase